MRYHDLAPRMGWLRLALAALLGTLVSVLAVLRADPPDDPLMKLNNSFRKQYAAARMDALVRSGPVIVVEGDKLVLLRGKERYVGDVLLTQYHRLKAIAHVPLAVYLGQQLWQQADLSQQLKDFAWWKALDETLEAALASLDKYDFSAAQKERQRKILQESKEFHGRADFKAEDLAEFARKMKPLILANATDAARLQIDAYHAQTTAWRKQLKPEEWASLRVVIMGSQMPRKGHLAVQYFAKLLKEPGEGKRIVYAEALFDEQRAVNLLGTHLLDTQIGAAFFDDPQRMHRDLLADAATEYLKQLKFD